MDTKDIEYLSMRLVDIILATCTDIKVLEEVKGALDEQVKQSGSEAVSMLNYASSRITIKILDLKGYTQLIMLVRVDPGEFEKALLMLTEATKQLVFAKKYVSEIIETYLEHINAQQEQLKGLQKEIDLMLYKECTRKLNLMKESCELAKRRCE